MGFNQETQSRRKFATISDGRIVVSHLNPIEGITQTRVNKNGKTVHEQFFKSFEGRITDISAKDTAFGRVWEVTMEDNGEEVVISWNYSSRYTNNFFRALPNVELSETVKLQPWSMTDKVDATKKVIGLALYQHDIKVPFRWDRENPGEMPELKQTKRKGKVEWDDSDQLEFFEKLLKSDILPKIAASNSAPF